MTVYFIRAGSGPLVKIGTTTNLGQRLVALQSGQKERLEVIGIINGDRYVEIFLHGLFAQYRETGEWFRYEGELKRYIEAIDDAGRTLTVHLPPLGPVPGPWNYEESAQRHGDAAREAWAELRARPDFEKIMARYESPATETDE